MYMSRLAAQKEWAFMKVALIYEYGIGTYICRCCMNMGFLFLSRLTKQGIVF